MVAKKGGGPKKPVQAELGSAKTGAEPPQGAGWAHPAEKEPGVEHMRKTPAPGVPGVAHPPVLAQREARPPPGAAVAMGRDGKPVWRQSSPNDADPYGNAGSYAPPGWVYEWKRYSIYNQVQSTYQSTIQRVGKWMAVMHESHPGVFGPNGSTGHIIHEGLILMERQQVLHDEAKAEEQNAADEKMRRAKRERGLTPMSAGVDTNTPEARKASYVQVKRALDWGDDPNLAQDLAAVRPAYDRTVNSID